MKIRKGQTNREEVLPADRIASFILNLRGQRVILDTDLAKLYGVETRTLNQALKRNRARFPQDFFFQLTAEEFAQTSGLRSQIVISNQQRGGRRYLPLAFTEHGALMAAMVLNSSRAVAMSVYVIRAFTKMREELAANSAIFKRLAEIEKDLIIHDAALRDIYQKLRPLLEPPAEPPKPEIGFHVKEDSIPYRTKGRSARL